MFVLCRLVKAEQEQHAAVVEKRALEQKYRGEIETAKVGGKHPRQFYKLLIS